ncbi:MAG: DUF2169 domain-containing protein [Sandaracinaceae bacterium]|nr:DUF2169 domain-containing protein [Sandaracinaceae bacterium]
MPLPAKDARTMLVVVKATFDLVDRGPATIAKRQTPCAGPEHHDGDTQLSLRDEGDFALIKPRGECMLAGSCHPPGAPVRASAVTFQVGALSTTIAVFGDRRWRRALVGKAPSDPEPFTSMPLAWERAFGGPGDPRNPHGRGLEPQADPQGDVHLLPNLEDPRALIGSIKDRPAPAGAFPAGLTWPARLALAGTYDSRWKKERFPFFASDLDPSFFLSAPEPLRLRSGFWAGNETIVLKHLVKGRPHVSTRLPSLKPRAFVVRADQRFEEVRLVLDTIKVDSDAEHIHAVWRGRTDVRDDLASDIAKLFLMHEPIDAARSASACRERMEALLRLRALEQSGFEAKSAQADEDAATLALIRFHEKSLALTNATLAQSVAQGMATLMTVIEPASAPAEAPKAPKEKPKTLGELIAEQLEGAGVSLEPDAEPDAIAAAFARAGVAISPVLASRIAKLEARRAWTPSARERALLDFAEGKPLRGDFTRVDLGGEDLSGVDAEGAILVGASLKGCKLDGAKLAGAVLAGALLDGASLRGADLRKVDLRGAWLREVDLEGALLDDAILEQACLRRANLSRASLLRTEAGRADLGEAVLEGAHAAELDLSEGKLDGARCEGASFADARLIAVDARGADLRRCDLTKVRAYAGARFDGADLRHATADQSRWRTSSMRGCNFSFATLGRADFAACDLTEAVFGGCAMRKAGLRGANLERAQLIKCDLMKADLANTNLFDSDLRGSSLFAAELFGARTYGARLELCDLTGTKLEGR